MVLRRQRGGPTPCGGWRRARPPSGGRSWWPRGRWLLPVGGSRMGSAGLLLKTKCSDRYSYHRRRSFPMQRDHVLLKAVDAVLVAPGATRDERILGYGAGILGAVFAAVMCALGGVSGFTAILLVMAGFDLFGGAVVNATPSCSRRFHESGRSTWSAIGFVAGHVHTIVLAVVLPQMPWVTAVVAYVGILLASILIILAPGRYRRPLAFMLAVLLIATCLVVQSLSMVVVWVIPVLVVKLLLAHLLAHPGDC